MFRTPVPDKPLNPKEKLVVKYWNGNQVEAVTKAGYKSPKKQATEICNRPHVKRAIQEKDSGFNVKLGELEAKGVKITRNDIINRLDKISKSAESEGARVSALGLLVNIFGLAAKHDKDTDFFAGWSQEELDEYARTGELPGRIRSGVPPSESQASGSPPQAE